MTAVTKTARPKLTLGSSKAAPIVIPSAPTPFPLRTLVRAAENVRRIRKDEDVASLASDIRAHGLLQSLIGYVDPDRSRNIIHIVGGGRRLQALDSLMMDGIITGDFPVPVLIRDRELAVELSLAENLQQRTMSPVDEVFAFKSLVDTYHYSPAELAQRYGYSERIVKQRLRLADLAPVVLDALAERTITLDSATAYAGTQDQALQAEIFTAQSKRSWDAHSTRNIRETIDAKGIRTTHPVFRFVGAERYEARGGRYEDDLFRGDVDGAKVLANPALLLSIAGQLIDEQMTARLPGLQVDPKLAPTIVGHIVVPGLKLASWGFSGPIPAPPGCAIVTYHQPAPMWQRIRDQAIPVHVLVGINDAGALIEWPGTVAVEKSQRDTVCPPAGAGTPAYVPPSAEQLAEIQKARGVVRWSRRLAVNSLGGSPLFAGTPLEGRAYWPEGDGEPKTIGGVRGVLVPVDVFVSDEEIAAQRKPAGARYAQERAELDQRQAERKAAEEAKDRRLDELADMDPPAIVVLDGAAWAREDDGSYTSTVDDAEPFDDWSQLINVCVCEAVEIGATFTTREEWKAALASAEAKGAELR